MSAFAGRPFRKIKVCPPGKTKRGYSRGPQRIIYAETPGRNRREKRANHRAAKHQLILSRRPEAAARRREFLDSRDAA